MDNGNNVYVSGNCDVTWSGPAGQDPINAFTGYYRNDIVVLKLNSSGAYQWHTFYGADVNDQVNGIVVSGGGSVYVTGWSTATWNSATGQFTLHAYSGNSDIFILNLNSSGAYQWHSFFGSASGDDAYALTRDNSGYVYVTGSSGATWNGPAGQSPLNAFTGNGDFFVLKLGDQGLAGTVRILRNGNPIKYYDKIQDAYNAAASGDTIQAQEMELVETLAFGDNKNVVIQGGYDSWFLLIPGMTTLNGALTVAGQGELTIENLIIKGP
jgi:hypothetical protein